MVNAESFTTFSIFSNLDPEWLRPLTSKLHRRQYQPGEIQRGEIIFRQDDPADRMHIVVKGGVRIFIAAEDGIAALD